MQNDISNIRYMSVNEIREKFIKFFEEKNHLKLKSSSLVPQNDKSLLLINSGMAPLKPFFTGQQIPPSKRITTCQKCIRTGDIENVGKTARHGTFFEMLGNFSFGDYFKVEAIQWAWEFFTKVLNLSEDKLYPSIYEDDDESFEIWHKIIGLAPEKIVRLGKADNFWEHGLGPCGPCSEIYFDKGNNCECDNKDCSVGCDCDRYMELWNLVFTQFNKEENGEYTKLKNPNIDTGMGLERIATVMQGVSSIFDIDTVKVIRDKICELACIKYGENTKNDISIRVITDHIRSTTFMTADGVLPSNEGRGYVLRRLLRRAVRHGKLLGIKNLFLAKLSKIVVSTSSDAYSELLEKKDYIYKILTVEEERFHNTIDNGMELLKLEINRLKSSNNNTLDGYIAFKLYDTYGFPLDLMIEILEEENLNVDEVCFKIEMEKQKNKARLAREQDTYMGCEETALHKIDTNIKSDFYGYTKYSLNNSKVLSIIVNDEIVNTANALDKVSIILDKTPFYAEMGGQAGDTGVFQNDDVTIDITNCVNFGGNKIVHSGKIIKGTLNLGDTVCSTVNKDGRLDTARNHTATHILQKVLKDVLGKHIEQAGSLLTKNRLRFDFTHFEAVTNDELNQIELLVNTHILNNHNIQTSEMTVVDAKNLGATALFGEKYGDIVRVINIGDYSIELCGGTHLTNSSQIGSFKIISENGISAGVRRIEAVTGFGALNFYMKQEKTLNTICETLKANPKNILEKCKNTIDENKTLTKNLESLKSKILSNNLGDFIAKKETINNMDILVTKVPSTDINSLKDLCDKIKQNLNNYVILLASEEDKKVNFIAMCSDVAIKNGIKSGDLVKFVANICDGGGGGRPNMAQAGGKDISKIDKALKEVMSIIRRD